MNYIQLPVNKIIMEEQHGFRPVCSTTTCNLIVSNFIHKSFQAGYQVDVVYTDFNKAFDSVNHCILIKILEKLRFDELLLTQCKSQIKLDWMSIVQQAIETNYY